MLINQPSSSVRAADRASWGRQTLWWGGCAWDSFAIPQLVATRCFECRTPRTCSLQRLYCDARCARRKSAAAGWGEGCTLDLATLWQLASRWYEGRLDSPHVQRDPARAAAYLREVGLDGPFWSA